MIAFRIRELRSFLSLAAVCVVLAGCGSDTSDIHGVVKLDGTPVADAKVTFILEQGSGPSASAMTDVAGEFRVEALPGRYKVIVFKRADSPNPAASSLPANYADQKTTPLSTDVPISSGTLTLELASKPQSKR